MIASASADIYYVPPPPVRVVLERGRPIVAVNASTLRVFPAQRAFFQLAVVAKPSAQPPPSGDGGRLIKPGVEEPTPTPIRPISAVSNEDLRSVRALLEGAGIAPDAITTRLTAGRDAVGQIFVEIDPVTPHRSAVLFERMLSATAEYAQIMPAGTIVMRPKCDAEADAQAIAAIQGQTTAALLANAAGTTLGPLMSNRRWYEDAYGPRLHVICGRSLPPLPLDAGEPTELGARAYPASVHRSMTFSLRRFGHVPFANVGDSSGTAFVENRLVAQQFVVPDDEPFVSAQGQAAEQVVPAGFVAVFRAAPGSGEPSSTAFKQLIAILRSAGIKTRDVLQSSEAVYVKVRSRTALTPVWKWTSKPPLDGAFDLAIDPFASNCQAIRRHVTDLAFARARARALIMASQAHARIGGVLAIVDAGQTVGAICGYGAAASIQRLSHAAATIDTVWPAGSGATFGSAVVVAWRLEVAPAARARAWVQLVPTYADYSTVDEAFATRGVGVRGYAREMRHGCGEAHLGVLASATRSAVARSRPRALQALLDQGEAIDISTGACTQRVLAVVAR